LNEQPIDRRYDTQQRYATKPTYLLTYLPLCAQLFVAMSVLGTMFRGYFFAFHLLNIVNNNQLLKGVIQAVTQNGLLFITDSVVVLFISVY